jgi:uncharacterized membrane-anchored protein
VVLVRSNSRISGRISWQRGSLVGGVRVAVQEDYAERLRACVAKALRRLAHFRRVNRCQQSAVCEHALRHLDAHVARDGGGKIAEQAPGLPPVASAHLQHVAEAGGGDQAGARTFVLQQRIGADGGAVHDSG